MSSPELVLAMPEVSRALKGGRRDEALELLRQALGEDGDLAEEALRVLERPKHDAG
ncbi:MAG: hypothetical protein M3364_09735 [Actinomycetota bacterium]|nr:hypothetical protein [Actinomycetota bacterium]